MQSILPNSFESNIAMIIIIEYIVNKAIKPTIIWYSDKPTLPWNIAKSLPLAGMLTSLPLAGIVPIVYH